MPELPEVETTRRGIALRLTGAVANSAVVRNGRLRWPVPEKLSSLIAGQTLQEIRRRAKYLLFVFEHGTLIVHLGMSGSLRVLTEAFPPEKHEHIDLLFENGLRLRYRDPRRFGAFLWTEGDPNLHPLLSTLGPEPLSAAFTPDYLAKVLANKNTAIKIAIMDQHIVVGVGNIYASEALFRAGILPQRPARSLNKKEVTQLRNCIRDVLEESITAGGSTLRDYVDSDGKAGYFTINNFVYARAGQACRQCNRIILTARQGQRATFWCANCQH
ncbi:MAG: bifunctional DNA-formamidopyrimidine glycosylase/DNA-(apurinic or apyrimidinic site) lyase [Formivibrio sp.]|nr:bifunctional DNA-formamidopyrimidine glycosylase/DNA-(apurinic or apyrimidinic site) lyase [Formivibrio sp.]